MSKSFYSLGLMSGTSGDGVDASIIQSDGDTQYKVILDKYFQYNNDIYQSLFKLKDKINSQEDLRNSTKEQKKLENKITLFHAEAVNEIIKDSKIEIDLIGFHGQTIFHNFNKKISKQLGDGKLLSKLSKKRIICNFRENDMKNGGAGAPLTPLFHKLIVEQNKIEKPVIILNLGGIANITSLTENSMNSTDIGPGNCLIDSWIKKKSNKKYDNYGSIASIGKINNLILNEAINSWNKKFKHTLITSFDTKDFNFPNMKKLSLEDGAATLTEYTSRIISDYFNKIKYNSKNKIIICGGGRKNNFLIKKISKLLKTAHPVDVIDKFGVDGDFVESQAFAYLAIRSYLKLPISFPETTGCHSKCTGGVIIKNF